MIQHTFTSETGALYHNETPVEKFMKWRKTVNRHRRRQRYGRRRREGRETEESLKACGEKPKSSAQKNTTQRIAEGPRIEEGQPFCVGAEISGRLTAAMPRRIPVKRIAEGPRIKDEKPKNKTVILNIILPANPHEIGLFRHRRRLTGRAVFGIL